LEGTELKESLQGQHSIPVNGKSVSWIDLSLSAVLEESAGAVVSALAFSTIQPKTQNICIDLVNGIIISSTFGSGESSLPKKSHLEVLMR
jgi:hypothetical protein